MRACAGAGGHAPARGRPSDPPTNGRRVGTPDVLALHHPGAGILRFRHHRPGLLQIIVVLGIAGGVGGSRVTRSAVIGVKENAYFQAAEAIGSLKWGILVRHVLPNIIAPIIIIFSINIGGVIIAEASLSFLGFGLPPNVPSWGGMLSREGRHYMEQAPWLALWPGLCLTLTVYSLNMFGDAVRDLLDPRLRGGGGRLGADAARSV